MEAPVLFADFITLKENGLLRHWVDCGQISITQNIIKGIMKIHLSDSIFIAVTKDKEVDPVVLLQVQDYLYCIKHPHLIQDN